MMNTLFTRALAFLTLAAATALHAQVPSLINYQGRIAVGTVNFDGTGQFKFALVNGDGTASYWSNDSTSTAGSEPAASVSLPVIKGLYSVQLGDTTLANMAAIPASVFNNPDVRIRVWFNNGVNGSQLLTPDQRITAVGYAVMAGNVQDGAITSAKIASGAVGSAQLASGAAATNLNASGQAGVASGGVVLSPQNNAALTAAGYVDLGISVLLGYDSWATKSSANAPSARDGYAMVWTGSEMIVWGGYNGTTNLADGARFNPTTDTWTALPTLGAPSARNGATAVWTGSEMIVWGGSGVGIYLNDGAKYSPSTNTWSPLTTTNAPAGRASHTAIWSGTEMIIWGGNVGGQTGFNTGGKYNPSTDSWVATSTTGAPAARAQQSAVWSGSDMIIWGGARWNVVVFNDGFRYNPSTDTWTSISTTNAPTARGYHTAVWTGSKMIVFGGEESYQQASPPTSGAVYDLASDTWTATSANALAGRIGHAAVWTGNEMIIWGGSNGNQSTIYNDGARYNPVINSWTALTNTGAPSARYAFPNASPTVWTGSKMLIFGGSNASGALAGTFSYAPPTTFELYQKP